jgi:hypothetical protein
MEQKDFQKRDEIVFGKTIDWTNRELPPGICERFENLDAEGIENLLELGFMELPQTMNSSPSIESFWQFAREMEQKNFSFKFEGFTYDPNYEHTDVVLEAIYYEGEYPAEIGLAFAKFVISYSPDDVAIEDNLLRAWWD